MAALETYLAEAVENIDYDVRGDRDKAERFVTALRRVIMLRPVSVQIDGSPVSFGSLNRMLEQAEAWLAAAALKGSSPSNGATTYYDTSNIRGH